MSNYCKKCRGFHCLGNCEIYTCETKESEGEAYATSFSEAAEKYVEKLNEEYEYDYTNKEIEVSVAKGEEKATFIVSVEATITYNAYEKGDTE